MLSVDDILNEISILITNRLSEVKFWNEKEIQPIIYAYILSGLQDCLGVRMNLAEEEILKLEKLRKNEKNSKKRHEIQLQIGSLHTQKRYLNRVGADLKIIVDRQTRYRILTNWVKEKYGEAAINEFYRWKDELKMQ